MNEYLKCVPSYRRPHNVPKMEELVGPDLLWFVHDMEDLKAYKKAGAEKVVVTNADNLCEQRQAVLDHCRAEGVWCVSMDDDVTRVAEWQGEGFALQPTSIEAVIDEIHEIMGVTKAHLGGCNYIGTFLGPKLQVRDIISAGFMVINTDSPVNWPTEDPLLAFRDQWEFSMRHIKEHELVVKLNWLTVAHKMNTGKGGLESQRTLQMQVDSGKEMLRRWPEDLEKLKNKRKEKILRPGEVRIIRKGSYRMSRHAQDMYALYNGEEP